MLASPGCGAMSCRRPPRPARWAGPRLPSRANERNVFVRAITPGLMLGSAARHPSQSQHRRSVRPRRRVGLIALHRCHRRTARKGQPSSPRSACSSLRSLCTGQDVLGILTARTALAKGHQLSLTMA